MKNTHTTFAKKHLKDIITLKYGKGLPQRDRRQGECPVYGSGGIVGSHNAALVKGPGIIVGRKGSIGTVFYEKNDFYPIDTVFYVELKPQQQLDFYFLSKLLSQLRLQDLNSDAAVPGLNRDVALRQEVAIPPPPHPTPHRLNPFCLRRPHRKQYPPHCDFRRNGAADLRRVVRAVPFSWT